MSAATATVHTTQDIARVLLVMREPRSGINLATGIRRPVQTLAGNSPAFSSVCNNSFTDVAFLVGRCKDRAGQNGVRRGTPHATAFADGVQHVPGDGLVRISVRLVPHRLLRTIAAGPQYARAVVRRGHSRLSVLYVNDPLLVAAAATLPRRTLRSAVNES